eukprot:3317810-Pleurochrysis_carterae.AAC.1
MARSRAAMTAAVSAPSSPAGRSSAKASGALPSRRWRAPPGTDAPPCRVRCACARGRRPWPPARRRSPECATCLVLSPGPAPPRSLRPGGAPPATAATRPARALPPS